MASSNLIRLGGLAAVVAGVLLVISEVLNATIDFDNLSRVALTGTYALQAVLFLIAVALLLAGLVGLYARQSEAAGSLGVAGFLLALAGTELVIGVSWEEVFIPPAIAPIAPNLLDAGPPPLVNFGFTLSFVLFALGWLLFGVATVRARIYPRAAAVLLIVGAVLAAFPLPFSGIVFAVAVAWLGFVLFTGVRGAPAEQPARVQ